MAATERPRRPKLAARGYQLELLEHAKRHNVSHRLCRRAARYRRWRSAPSETQHGEARACRRRCLTRFNPLKTPGYRVSGHGGRQDVRQRHARPRRAGRPAGGQRHEEARHLPGAPHRTGLPGRTHMYYYNRDTWCGALGGKKARASTPQPGAPGCRQAGRLTNALPPPSVTAATAIRGVQAALPRPGARSVLRRPRPRHRPRRQLHDGRLPAGRRGCDDAHGPL